MMNAETEKLHKIMKYAYQTVPIYSRLAEKYEIDIDTIAFKQLPIVDKSYYAETGASGLSSNCIGDYIANKLQKIRTSGSTGKCTEIYWSEKDTRRSLLSLWLLRKKYYGINAADRLTYFYPALHGVEGQYDEIEQGNTLALSKEYLFNGRLMEAYQRILEYNPVWMILQPSVAMLLCDMADEVGEIPDALRYIEFTGEYLEITLQKRVEATFNCLSANQYGTKEVNSIAYECPAGNMHIMSDNVYLETVHTGNGEELCVTTLRNRVMPLVRFNIEDRGHIVPNVQCACGKCGDTLEIQVGRSNDWILHEDGAKTHAYALMQIIQQTNYMTEGSIIQYQIQQVDFNMFLVRLIIDSDYEDEFDRIADGIIKDFRERMGEDTCTEVIRVDKIFPEERTGKISCFTCMI